MAKSTQNDRIKTIERYLYGEKLNGVTTIGVIEKVETMYNQFVFDTRIRKTIMLIASTILASVIAIGVKLFVGDG